MVKKWTASEKVRIVLESLTTSIGQAELMQKVQFISKYFLSLERQILRMWQECILSSSKRECLQATPKGK